MKIIVALITLLMFISQLEARKYSFSIDKENNRFLLDEKPFRYISGSMHYWRVHPDLWLDRLQKIRAGGFNALQFYIQWNLHEKEHGSFDFSGRLNFTHYMDLAASLGLKIILRPGPYICAETDGGGLPFWIYRFHPDVKLRSSDPNYLYYVGKWWDKLLPMIKPYLHQNQGGPIIMIQLENEYGSYGLQTNYCDVKYMEYLRDKAVQHLGNGIVLFTTDGDSENDVQCGSVSGAYATIDFGPGTNVSKAASVMRKFEPKGPFVNSEYYPGWLDYWSKPHNKVGTEISVKTFDEILKIPNSNVNVYMVHGGTSFGFEAGANTPPFSPEPTSYDYDAPISESGDLTAKYFAFKKVISKYLPIPDMKVSNSSKEKYGHLNMKFVSTFFDTSEVLLKFKNSSLHPMTFEELSQNSGYVLYETVINTIFDDPSWLQIYELHDRGYVFINDRPQGILSRGQNCLGMPISIRKGEKLQILVENQGRIGYGAYAKDFKGITKTVQLGNKNLQNWKMYSMPLNDVPLIFKYVNEVTKKINQINRDYFGGLSRSHGGRASFWTGKFMLPDCHQKPRDTFLSLPGWNKGVAFLNGFNLGRYWPRVGPQLTLYVPSPILRGDCQINQLILFEQEAPGCKHSKGGGILCQVEFVDKPNIDGSTPINLKSMKLLPFRRL